MVTSRLSTNKLSKIVIYERKKMLQDQEQYPILCFGFDVQNVTCLSGMLMRLIIIMS